MKKHKNRFVYIVSLGCPKNFVDTEIMSAALITCGFGITPVSDNADVYMINTCAFIPTAREEAEEIIREALRWKKKQARKRKIVVAGCLNQWDKEGVYRKMFPEVDLWPGINDVPDMGKLFDALFHGESASFDYATGEYLYDDATPRIQLTLPHYAYIKISDGCNNCCSYCAIPRIRGAFRSRTIDSVLKEAENLIKYGTKELILIGQDLTAFGNDNNTGTLTELLTRLDQLSGDFKIRLLYTHPAHFSDELIKCLANAKHILPYIDIPLQHISDKILVSMGRKVSRARISELLATIRSSIPGVTIRTTFITGYPGESEEDYKLLKEFVKEQKFERLGVFPYYPEPDTPAAGMPDQVPPETAIARSQEIMEIQAEISLEHNKKLVGTEINVIIDSFTEDDVAICRSYMDAPEIDNCIYAETSADAAPGDVIRLEITACSEYDLEGIQKGIS